MSVVGCAPSHNVSLVGFHIHDAPERPSFPACAGEAIVADATQLDLSAWNVQLLRLLLSRRRMTAQERVEVRRTLGQPWFGKGRVYLVLQHTLHRAVQRADFRHLAAQRQGLWLEFGVLTGLSTNLTARYLGMVPSVPPSSRVDGFDTFTGLPEAWPNGKGGFYYKKGSFSWAARNRGPTPPVHERVRLHAGLFNNTLGPFLRSADGAAKPLAWANIDCDLYGGTVDALAELGARMCSGSVIHFHELLKDRFWKARHLTRGNVHALVPSEEARALYEWLRARPKTQLEMLDVISQANSDAAAVIVRVPPPEHTPGLCS